MWHGGEGGRAALRRSQHRCPLTRVFWNLVLCCATARICLTGRSKARRGCVHRRHRRHDNRDPAQHTPSRADAALWHGWAVRTAKSHAISCASCVYRLAWRGASVSRNAGFVGPRPRAWSLRQRAARPQRPAAVSCSVGRRATTCWVGLFFRLLRLSKRLTALTVG